MRETTEAREELARVKTNSKLRLNQERRLKRADFSRNPCGTRLPPSLDQVVILLGLVPRPFSSVREAAPVDQISLMYLARRPTFDVTPCRLDVEAMKPFGLDHISPELGLGRLLDAPQEGS